MTSGTNQGTNGSSIRRESRFWDAADHEPKSSKMRTRICSDADDDTSSVAPKTQKRLVVVRYFLDRPGYGLHNSAARLWFNPPATCTPMNVRSFLRDQGIAMDGLLVEVYLDKFQSFMMLEACEASLIEWHFDDTTYREPGVLNIRLTDLENAEEEEQMTEQQRQFPCPKESKQPQQANTVPAGLFSFSMMVGLETTNLMSKMFPGTVSHSFVLTWGPYMLFVGGLLQTIVGIQQILRNNIYGAVAFLGFGSFWFSNGTKAVLETYVAGDGRTADDLVELPDPVGFFIRNLFIFAFSCALFKQTFVMNKLSTTLIGLLCLKLGFGAFTGWSKAMQWLQLIFGWTTSMFAFYVFLAEFTNQVYHREVFHIHKWSDKQSPEEVFGAAGRTGTLNSKAARLRRASYPTAQKIRATLSERHMAVAGKN